MAEVALFHHTQGLTPGVVAFAEELRHAGHAVHAPDLFEGRTFATLEEGLAHAEQIGFGEVMERGVRAVEGLPAALVYAGFSLGVGPAQSLAQTRPGARGHCCSTPVCRSRSSARRGRRACPCRSTRWTRTRSSITGGTFPPPAPSSRRPGTGSCSSPPEVNTSSPTSRCRRTTRTPPRSWASECWPSLTGSTGLIRPEDFRVPNFLELRKAEVRRISLLRTLVNTAHCSDSEPMRTWLHDERLLGRSQTKDSFRRRRRDAQGSGGSHLLREPLLGQTIRKQGLTRRIPGPQEAPRIRSEARRDG